MNSIPIVIDYAELSNNKPIGEGMAGLLSVVYSKGIYKQLVGEHLFPITTELHQGLGEGSNGTS